MSCPVSVYFKISPNLGLGIKENCKRELPTLCLVAERRHWDLWVMHVYQMFVLLPVHPFESSSPAHGSLNRQTWVSSLPPRSTVPEQKANSLVFRLHPPGLCSEELPDSPHHWLLQWKAEVSSTLFMDWKLLARWASKVQTLMQGNCIPSLRVANQKKQCVWIWIWF